MSMMMTAGYRLRFFAVNWRLLVRRLFGQRARITVGSYTYGVPRIRWWGEASGLYIGRFCSIARDVTIFLGGNHRTDWITTYPFNVRRPWLTHTQRVGHPWTRGDVRIGNDVWLGERCTILSGVTVGDGGVVAANAVVSRDVPPYAIVAGNPARVVRERFAPEEVAKLMNIRWWDWSDEDIAQNLDALLSPSLGDLKLPVNHD